MVLERKAVSLELKADEAGAFTAVFATFDVIDHDGDVTLPGAFDQGARIPVGAYGHASRDGELPVGAAAIASDTSTASIAGRFFIDTPHGDAAYRTIKNLVDEGVRQEWSYIFTIEDSERGERDGRPVRILRKLKVHSVDPVLAGAGLGTRVTAIKTRGEPAMSDLRAQRIRYGVQRAKMRLRGLR